MGKKTSKTKKILSIILSVVMIMSMLSVSMTTASAATTDDEGTGGSVTSNIIFDNSILQWDNVYILIGHTDWTMSYLLGSYDVNSANGNIYTSSFSNWGDGKDTKFYFTDQNPNLSTGTGSAIDTYLANNPKSGKYTVTFSNVSGGLFSPTPNETNTDVNGGWNTGNGVIDKQLYFDNSKTKWDNVYIVIGRGNYRDAYQLEPVEAGSNKYRVKIEEWGSSKWEDFMLFFFADSDLVSSTSGSIIDVTRSGQYTGNFVSEPVDDMFVPDKEDTILPISGLWAANSTYVDGYFHNATADPVEGGSVSVTGEGAEVTAEGTLIPADSVVTYEATANTGYGFLGWFDGETQITTDNPYSFTASTNTSLTAKFESYYEYGVSTNDVTKGIVSVTDGTNTSDTGIKSDAGKTITYTATAQPGFYFKHWTNTATGDVVSTDSEYNVASAQTGLSLTAVFNPKGTDYSAPSSATLALNGSDNIYLNEDVSLDLNATLDSKTWEIDADTKDPISPQVPYVGNYTARLYSGSNIIQEVTLPSSETGEYTFNLTDTATDLPLGVNTLKVEVFPETDSTKIVETSTINITVNANESFTTDAFMQDVKKDGATVGGTVTGTTFTTENVYANNGEYQFGFNGVTATYNGVATPVNYEVYDGETLIASTTVTDVTTDMVYATFTPVAGVHNYTVKATITNGTKYSVAVGTIELTVKSNELQEGVLTGNIDSTVIDTTTTGTFNKTSYDETQGNFSFTFNAIVNEKVSTGADVTYRYELAEQGSATPIKTSNNSSFTFNINEENLLEVGLNYNVKAYATYASNPTQTVEKTYSFTVTETPEWTYIYIAAPKDWSADPIDRVAIFDSATSTTVIEIVDGTYIGEIDNYFVHVVKLPYEYIGEKYVGLKNSNVNNIYGSKRVVVDGGYYKNDTAAPTVGEVQVTNFVANSVDGEAVADNKNVTVPIGGVLNVTTTLSGKEAVYGGPVRVDYYIGNKLVKSSKDVVETDNSISTDFIMNNLDEEGLDYNFVSGETYTITAVATDGFTKYQTTDTINVTMADPIFAINSYTKSKDFGTDEINIAVNGSNLNLGGYRYSTGDGQLTDFKYFNSTRNATITFPDLVDDTVVVYYYGLDHTTPMYKAVYSTGENSTRIAYVRPEKPANDDVVQDVKIYILDGDSAVTLEPTALSFELDSNPGMVQHIDINMSLLETLEGEGGVGEAIEYHFVPNDFSITEKGTAIVLYDTQVQNIDIYGPLLHTLPTTLTYNGPTEVYNGEQIDLSAYISQDGTRKMKYVFAVDFLNSTSPSHYDAIVGEVDTENGYSASVPFTAPKTEQRETQVTIKVYAYSIDPESPKTGKGSEIDPLYTSQIVTIIRDDVNKIYLDASNHPSLKACVTQNESGQDVVYMKTSTGRIVEMVPDPEDVNATGKRVFVGNLTDEELDGDIRFSNNNGAYDEGSYYDTKRDEDGATFKFGQPENGYIYSKDELDVNGDKTNSENWGSYNTGDTTTITEEDLKAELALTALNHYDFPADVNPSATEVLEDPQAYEQYIDHTKADVQYIFYDNSVTKWHEVWLYSWGGFDSGVDDKQYKTKRVEMMKIDTGDGRDIRYYKLPAGSLKSWYDDASQGFLFMDRDTSYFGLDYMQSTDLGNFTYDVADANGGNIGPLNVNIKNNIFDADSNVIYPLFRADGFRNATETNDTGNTTTLKQRAFIEVVTDLYNTDYEVANVTFNIIPHNDTGLNSVHLYTNSLHDAYDFPFPYVDAFRRETGSDAFVASLNIPYTVDESTGEITVAAEFRIEIDGVYYGADKLESSIDDGFLINGKAIETGEVWLDLPTRVAGYSASTGITENVVDIIGYEHSNTDITTSVGGSLDANGTHVVIGYGNGLEARVDLGIYTSNEQYIEMGLQNTAYFEELSQEGVVGRITQRDIHINANTTQTSQETLLYQFSGWFKDRTLFQNPFDDLGNELKAVTYTPETTALVNLGAFYEPRKGDKTYTSYFILTDDMMNDLDNVWTIENLRWDAVDITGGTEVIGGGIPEELNPYLWAFGKPYDIDGTIFKVEYHSNIKSIRFYQEGTGDTIDVPTKMSTSQLNVQNGMRNQKVFYVLDYSKYDSTVVTEIESGTGTRVFGWYDLMYDVDYRYPNERERFDQAGVTLTQEELNGSNSSAQRVQLYVSANYKNVSPRIDSIYNDYTWGYSGTSKLIEDQITSSTPVIPNDVDTKGYKVDILIDNNSQASVLTTDDSGIANVSTVPLLQTSQESTLTYYKYNENYTSLVNPTYTNNKTIDVEYKHVVQLETPEVVEVDGKEVSFVGWFDETTNSFVSYYYKHAFVVTQDIELVPIYDDTQNLFYQMRLDPNPTAVVEEPQYETFLDDTTQKVKMIFPIKYLIPNDVTEYKLYVRYFATKTPIHDFVEDAYWSDGIEVTNSVNAQNRVNYAVSTNIYKADGTVQDAYLYVQPYIVYTDKDGAEQTVEGNPSFGASPSLIK